MSRLASHKTYTDATFQKLDIQGKHITDSEFSDCKFVRCNFSATALQNCKFYDCDFGDCTLKMTNLDSSKFSNVQFSRCNLLGVNWSEVDCSEWATNISAIAFDECDLKYAVFFGLALKKLKMLNCNAAEVNFAEAQMTEADFTGTDFEGAVFLRTDLEKANFVGAKNYSLNIRDNNTDNAKFALPEATRLLYHLGIVIVDA